MRLPAPLLLFLSLPVCGHDLYLLPAKFFVPPASTLTVAFHNGDAFPESEVAPKAVRMLDPKLTGKRGNAPIVNLRESGKETLGTVTVPGQGSFWISVHSAPNLIELEPAKFDAYLKEEGLTDVLEYRERHGERGKPGKERYSKFAKSLIVAGAPDDSFSQLAKFPIEIVPLADPAKVKPGARLAVRVLFRGMPAPGLLLESAWASAAGHEGKIQPVGRTDAEGKIAVPLPKAGLWRLHTLKMERCADQSAADWESYWASFTFALR